MTDIKKKNHECLHLLFVTSLVYPVIGHSEPLDRSNDPFLLQAVIRRSLSESGCPPHIIDQLMENAHERRWPPGLSTLETRQVVCTR